MHSFTRSRSASGSRRGRLTPPWKAMSLTRSRAMASACGPRSPCSQEERPRASAPSHLDLAVVARAHPCGDAGARRHPRWRGQTPRSAHGECEVGQCHLGAAGRLPFCPCAEALRPTFPNGEISRRVAHAASDVCSGEIIQTQRRFDLKLSVPDYYKIIEMKTGGAFRGCDGTRRLDQRSRAGGD